MGLRAISELATQEYYPVQFGLKWPIEEQEGTGRARSTSSEVSTVPFMSIHPVVPVVEKQLIVRLVAGDELVETSPVVPVVEKHLVVGQPAGEETVEVPPMVPLNENHPVVRQVAREETGKSPFMVLVINKRPVVEQVAGENVPPMVPVIEKQPVRQQPVKAPTTTKRKTTNPAPKEDRRSAWLANR